MAVEKEALALRDVQEAPEAFRRFLAHYFSDRLGVVGATSWAVSQSGTPGLSVSVSAGAGIVPGDETNTQGAYFCQSTSATTVNITTPHATLARRDLIVARVRDNQYGTGPTSAFTLEAIPGAPSTSPTDPTRPPNCLVLARVVVNPQPDITVLTADITDLRVGTTHQWGRPAAVGGVHISTSTTRPFENVQNGQIVYETDSGQLRVFNGSTYLTLDAIAGAWIPVSGGVGYKNGYVEFGPGTQPVEYRKVGDMVYLRGLVGCGAAADNTAIFTLPSGSRPLRAHIFHPTVGANVHGRIDVNPTGDVILRGSNFTFVSLNDVRFSTA